MQYNKFDPIINNSTFYYGSNKVEIRKFPNNRFIGVITDINTLENCLLEWIEHPSNWIKFINSENIVWIKNENGKIIPKLHYNYNDYNNDYYDDDEFNEFDEFNKFNKCDNLSNYEKEINDIVDYFIQLYKN